MTDETNNRKQATGLQGEILLRTPSDDVDAKIALHSIGAIRRELGRVYRDMRSGAISCGDGTKLAFVLGELRKLAQTEQIARRLEEVRRVIRYRKE